MNDAVRRSPVALSFPLLAAACGSGQTTGAVTSASTPTAIAATSSASTSTTIPLSVTSSIPDGSNLADPVAWVASPSSLDGLMHVDFIVDGTVKWTEYKTPYFFSDDNNLLHPWLLGLGEHVLTVLAVTQSGAHASSTSHVTVTAGPQVPAALTGTFSRSVTQADIARILPTGVLLFDDPKGSGGGEGLRATADGVLGLEGPVDWLVPKDRQGGFCLLESPGQYHWAVVGRTLTITGNEKKCADRDAVFIGTWTQA